MPSGKKWQDLQKEWYNDNRATCSLDLVDRNNETHLARLLELIPDRKPGIGLEIGCGEGWYSGKLGSAVGIDISHESLKVAAKNGMKVVVADAENLPFRDGAFSFVYGFAILHHLADIPKGLAEMGRVVAPGGFAAFGSENNSACPMNYVFPLIYRNWNIEKGFRRISPGRLEGDLLKAGFSGFRHTVAGFAVYGLGNTVYRLTRWLEWVLSAIPFAGRFAGFVYFSAVKRRPEGRLAGDGN